MRIIAYPHEQFDMKCYSLGLYDYNVENDNNHAFISIIGTDGCRKYHLEDEETHWFKKNHINVLNLEFDDVTEDTEFNGHLLKAMTEEQAQKCVDFIENNIGKHIYIHCRAGISRSGAIAKFIIEFYNENNIYNVSDFKFYNKRINPNNHVLSLLKRIYYKKHGLFIEENNIV